MKKMYSIGEMAKLMGISVQTLRHYSNINLITPCFINKETGYRFYDAGNFSTIDRAKYLQRFGFSLEEIKNLYQENSISYTIDCLNNRAKKIEDDIHKKQALLNELRWYSQFFSHAVKRPPLNTPYIRYFPERYAFAVDRMPNEFPEDANARLYRKKNEDPFRHLEYRRQNMLLYNSKAFFKGELSPLKYGFYLGHEPDMKSRYILTFQEGYYICFQTQVLTGNWSPDIFSCYFKNTPLPPYIIADEYEDNFFQFRQCVYEVQLFSDQPALGPTL